MSLSLPSAPPQGDTALLAPPPEHWPGRFLARLVPRRFRSELEAEYLGWRHVRVLATWRALLVAACLAFGSFTLWDWLVAPDQFWMMLPARVLFCSATLGLLVASYSPTLQLHVTQHLVVLSALSGASLAWILSLVPDGWRLGVMGFAFPVVALMVIPQARVMAVNSAIIVMFANASMWLHETDSITWTSANFFLIGLGGMSYVLAFVSEARERRLFELEWHLTLQATVDALSGAWNRRHFMQLAENELHRARRYGRPVSLLILDIDHFKKINDGFGHATGNAAIRSLCATCWQTLRRSDALGRLGGEEFGIVLPETGLEAALGFAERLRAAIAASALPLESQPDPLRFTVSIGVAQAHADDTFDTLMQRADVALYAAKGAGRNQVRPSRD